MNTPEPRADMEQWLQDTQGIIAIPIAMSLGLKPSDGAEALSAIRDWLRQPRDAFALRTAELSLRAFIDFECAIAIDESHQEYLDNQLLGAVDAGVIPAKNRAAINDALRDREQKRQPVIDAVMAWRAVRPDDEAIRLWWLQRTHDWIQSASRPPTQ